MYRILIVEDDKDIQEVLKNYLTVEGYEIILASDGMEGVSLFHGEKPDLVLLDLMLPKIDGFTVCELIRKESQIPIIMVTARDSVEDQIKGLKLLADDYIPKPFNMSVLLCKIAAILRRIGKEETRESVIYRDLQLDVEGYRAVLAQKDLVLTQKEFELLRVFLTNVGRVFTRQKLLDLVWGIDYFGDERIVDTHIKNLRKKLDRDYIQTVRGVGYRVEKQN